ncbi:MAG: agmatine deiminase family protein, partial [Planctomycetaceae bacterium]|nr:agmatine deiminase family protein [Planctomycetaceae bacterium]
EWENHSATWLAWPVNPATWPGIFDRIPPAFAKLVATLARFEPVRILAPQHVAVSARALVDQECERAASSFEVQFVDIAVNDSWCRDHGPIFLNRRTTSLHQPASVILDWDYNAWGGKYEPFHLDQQTARRIAEFLKVPAIQPGIVLEGGAIDGNGAGTILTTTSCLLNETRNGPVTKAQMESYLHDYLGAQQTVWLPGHGIIGDDTDGHVDQVARFTSRTQVLTAAPWDDDADEAADLRANLDAVVAGVTAEGDQLTAVPVKLPPPKFQQGQRLPASYCNFCFANGAVIVPTFQDPADDEAMSCLQRLFPDRTIAGVDSLDLVWGLGSFHCLSQQQPAC